MSFINSESVHLQLEQINLRTVCVVLRIISAIVTCLPLPFILYTLDEILVEFANIQALRLSSMFSLSFFCEMLFWTLLEGGVALGRDPALAVLGEEAAQAVARGGGGGGGPSRQFFSVLKTFISSSRAGLFGGRSPRPLRSRAPRGAGRRGPPHKRVPEPVSSQGAAQPRSREARPSAAALRLLWFPARVPIEPLSPCSRPEGGLPRLAGLRRESP